MSTDAKRWSKEDEEFLIANYQKMSNKELSDRFGVTTISVQRKLSRLGLIRQVQKKWEGDEEGFLRANYLDKSDKELAEIYGVTEISIKRKLNRLGLKRNLRKRKGEPAPPPAKKAKAAPPREPKPKREAQAEPAPVVRGAEREYSLRETYEIGETLYHSAYKEKGKVIEKHRTSGGTCTIVVLFPKAGRKLLVEGVG